MSADEDTELRDLVAQTLEANGTLGKLRAQLRASVFLALEDQENGQNKTPFLNKELRSFLSTREGKLTASLVQEFLEFFNLDFTLAVFKPESGVNDREKRTDLLKELNIQMSNAPPNAPLLTYLLGNSSKSSINNSSQSSGDAIQVAKDLTEKQIEDARKKFEFYDKDSSGAIDKDELRDLFMDMFPHFHCNMLERYVNDEFKAVDRDFSSSIDFDEFLGMYKRLFLFCRTVVATDVEDIVSPTHRPGVKKTAQHQQPKNAQTSKSNTSPQNADSLNNSMPNRNSITARDDLGSDPEEDPFFDDIPASAVSFNTLSSIPTHSVSSATRKATPYRPSQIPRFQQQRSELEKTKEKQSEPKENGGDGKDKGKQAGSSMSSLNDLPALSPGRGSGMGSLAGAPPLGRPKSPSDDLDKNLRAIDKRIEDLGLDSQHDDYEYEEDFIPEHSQSQKSPSNSKADGKTENGSIAEEIDDEEIEDFSIEGDDFDRSEKSGIDGLTTDCSISQVDGGFDYMEDPVSP